MRSAAEVLRSRGTLRGIWLAVGLLLGGCASGPEDGLEAGLPAVPAADERLEGANDLLALRRYGEALERFRVLRRERPELLEAGVGIGEAQLGLGNYQDALAAFDEVLAAEPPGSEAVRDQAMQGRGIALLRLGRIEDAIPALQQVASADPTRWRAWNALGQAFDQRGRFAEAKASYDQALWGAPRNAGVHNNLGFSLLSQGEHDAAVTAFLHALELDPSLDVARANLRLALAAQGEYAEALAGVDRPALPEALNNIGYVALMRGDYDRAEAYFLRALEVSPSFFEPAWRNLQYLETLKGAAERRAGAPTS